MTWLRRKLKRLRRREDGSATLEFVILFPIVMTVFVNCFEMGMIMLRQTMLDRSVDLAVREIRIGEVQRTVFHNGLRRLICSQSGVLKDCESRLRLEMRVVDPRTWTGLDPQVDCVNLDDPAAPPQQFIPGAGNQLMVLRACHLFEPLVSNFALGAVLGDLMDRESGDMYRLVSVSSFVVEPRF
jgi:hypothetical protein